MGEYADYEVDRMIDGWTGGNGRGWGEPSTLYKRSKTCNSCGAKGLYWHQHEGKWRLHHHNSRTDSYTLHVCEFKPRPTTAQPLFPSKGELT